MPGGYDDHLGNSKAVIFMLDDNPDGAAKSLTLTYATLSSIRVGDHKPGAGQFVPVGTAVAETRTPEKDYGGADGAVGGGVILAEYVPAGPLIGGNTIVGGAPTATSRVYPLDNLGQRTSRLKPWIVGQNISLLCDPTKPSKGFVLRGNQMGDKGFDAHVYIAAPAGPGVSAPIILHHRSPNPPQNSTPAYDPDLPQNQAPLSDALRIVSGIDGFCKKPGATSSKAQAVIRWVVINATLSGGRFSGYFAAHYAGGTALHSAETSGNLTISTSKHNLGIGDDGIAIRPGANHCDGLWTRGNPKFDAPLDIEDVEEPDVMDQEGHPMRVHCQHDNDVKHSFTCGPRDGLRRWHIKEPIVERPPCEGAKQPGHSVVFPTTAIGYFVGQLEMNGVALLSNPRA